MKILTTKEIEIVAGGSGETVSREGFLYGKVEIPPHQEDQILGVSLTLDKCDHSLLHNKIVKLHEYQ